MKNLKMTFKTGSKTHSVQLKNVAQEFDEKTIKAEMQALSALDLFFNQDGKLYDTPYKAEYIDTNEKEIFDSGNTAVVKA